MSDAKYYAFEGTTTHTVRVVGDLIESTLGGMEFAKSDLAPWQIDLMVKQRHMSEITPAEASKRVGYQCKNPADY